MSIYLLGFFEVIKLQISNHELSFIYASLYFYFKKLNILKTIFEINLI